MLSSDRVSPLFSSMPAVADLMETCIDDVLRTPVVAAATDEAGPSNAYASASEDPLSLSGEHRKHHSGSSTFRGSLVVLGYF